MASRRLTQLMVDRLRLAHGERVEIRDGTVPGLTLRASWAGSKTYFLRYRFRGQQRRTEIGKHPSCSLSGARTRAKAILVQVDALVDPVAPTPRSGHSVRAVAEDWLRRDQAGNRSLPETKRILEREVLPAWGDKPLGEIRRRDVIELIEAIADRGAPIQANRTLARIRRLFQWACGRDLLDVNPAAHVQKPGQERRRDRVLADSEVGLIWRACEGWTHPFARGVQLLILTLARRAEIFEARWREINLPAREISLPAERTKIAEGRVVPLSPPAVEILRNLMSAPAESPDAFVISHTGAHPLGSIGKLKRQLDARIECVLSTKLAPWTLHDLRRTGATGLQKLGVRLEVIEAALGHVSGSRAGIVGVYQKHRWEPELRAALVSWAEQILRF